MTNLYQIIDRTAGAAAGPILLDKRSGPAIRAFYSVLADAKTLPGQYPEQFDLLLLGTQDEDSCQITPCAPETVATGAGWLQMQQREAENKMNL